MEGVQWYVCVCMCEGNQLIHMTSRTNQSTKTRTNNILSHVRVKGANSYSHPSFMGAFDAAHACFCGTGTHHLYFCYLRLI